jgi:hypothetical protein
VDIDPWRSGWIWTEPTRVQVVVEVVDDRNLDLRKHSRSFVADSGLVGEVDETVADDSTVVVEMIAELAEGLVAVFDANIHYQLLVQLMEAVEEEEAAWLYLPKTGYDSEEGAVEETFAAAPAAVAAIARLLEAEVEEVVSRMTFSNCIRYLRCRKSCINLEALSA